MNYRQLKSKIENLSYLDLIDYNENELYNEVCDLNFPIDVNNEIFEYLWLLIQDQRNQLSFEQCTYENDDGGQTYMSWLQSKVSDSFRHSILWNYQKAVKDLKEYGVDIDL